MNNFLQMLRLKLITHVIGWISAVFTYRYGYAHLSFVEKLRWNYIVSPCDGRVLTCGEASRGLIEQVKGITYTRSSFFGVRLTAGLMKLQQQSQTRKNSSTECDDAYSYAESLLKYRGHALYYPVSIIKKRMLKLNHQQFQLKIVIIQMMKIKISMLTMKNKMLINNCLHCCNRCCYS
jgi:phosphatidylserine decarboxylase